MSAEGSSPDVFAGSTGPFFEGLHHDRLANRRAGRHPCSTSPAFYRPCRHEIANPLGQHGRWTCSTSHRLEGCVIYSSAQPLVIWLSDHPRHRRRRTILTAGHLRTVHQKQSAEEAPCQLSTCLVELELASEDLEAAQQAACTSTRFSSSSSSPYLCHRLCTWRLDPCSEIPIRLCH